MAVSLASPPGQLEINHFEPVIASRLFDSIELLSKSTRIVADKCIAGSRPRPFASEPHPVIRHGDSFRSETGVRQRRQARACLGGGTAAVHRSSFERGLLTHDEVLDVLRESTEYHEEAA
ncbi:hypothetical protein QA640_44105 (plasmid) [Bradyrhizobium sp. CB82]|uniref:hypothetical protein n=1 Tax=Bradyrhizobium sp. CB82 TaxID=3039159 RepID=UPI0024B07EE4|nr:hypothetical protein [Bradyrhizobium sp. CB82]WFU45818.1 hypothetical protein QA640_44105 [Bradyrhizobium sp. CB82]